MDIDASNSKATCYVIIIGGKKKKIFLRTGAGDIDIFYEVFWKKVYTLNTSSTFNCIIDLGANIGLSAIYFSSVFKEATVFAVEPDMDNYNLLLQNCYEEIKAKRIVPVHAAAYVRDIELYVNKSGNAYNSTVSEEGDPNNVVKGTSIKKLCRDYGIEKIDLLKIDIEGAEQFLFEDNFDWLKIVNYIIIETHSETAKLNFIKAVEEYGFLIKVLTADGRCELLLANNTLVS